jgi:hypothetical protein
MTFPDAAIRVLEPAVKRRFGAAALCIALGAVATATGCPVDREGEGRTAPDDRLEVGRVATEFHAFGADAEPIELSTSLDGLVRTEVSKSRSLRLREGSEEARRRGAKLRVRAMVAPDGTTGELHAIVSARLDRTGSIPLSADIDAVRPGASKGGQLDESIYVRHLEKAVREAVQGLDEQVRLLRGGNSTLVDALESPEPSVRVAAARELGERRAREAVEPLCSLLRREEGHVGEAAVGALAAIGDRRAVPCLIDWAGDDEQRLVLVIDPLAAVGGDEARAFLEMVASGHESPGIRRVAEHALERAGGGGAEKGR